MHLLLQMENVPEQDSLPMDHIRLDYPSPAGDTVSRDGPWYTYRHEVPSSATPYHPDGFATLASNAVWDALDRVELKVQKLSREIADDVNRWEDFRSRTIRFHQLAEDYFQGDNIGNLFGQLVTALLVRVWEVPLLTNLVAYRMTPLPPRPRHAENMDPPADPSC